MNYEVSVNNKLELKLSYKNGQFIFDEQVFNIDLLKANGGYSVIHNNRSYFIHLISFDKESKSISFKINENRYDVSLADSNDLLLKKMNIDFVSEKKATSLKAPMPGLIVDITVKSGTSVKKGDPLLILEAMKMENLIKAPNDLSVKKICVNTGDTVEKNELLIEFE
tara:strand:- start:1129 stop:1629 length:501 start_codon:yes stop_codon:yes gene_type:complete